MRSRYLERLCDDGQNDLWALNHDVVWDAKHASAVALELCGPPAVVLQSRNLVVLTTVELDDEARRRAVEIHDEWTDGVLAPELGTETQVPQMPPQHGLRVSGPTPQLSSTLLASSSHEAFSEPHPRRCVPADPHPQPSPASGRGGRAPCPHRGLSKTRRL